MDRYGYKDSQQFFHVSAGDREVHGILKRHWNPDHTCPYCNDLPFHFVGKLWESLAHPSAYCDLMICVCGFWKLALTDLRDMSFRHLIAILKKFDISRADAPLDAVKAELASNWRYSKHISAKTAEDLVASVFKDHLGDCEIHYLTDSVYAPDGGIDFVLVFSRSGEEIAFQVKRRQSDQPERVEPVRAFLGAIAMSRFKQGFYVTTASRYTSTVKREFEGSEPTLKDRKLAISLIDGSTLYKLLNLNSFANYSLRGVFAAELNRFKEMEFLPKELGLWFEERGDNTATIFRLLELFRIPGHGNTMPEDA